MPTPANATLFAPKGFAFNLSAVVKSSATGNPIASALTNLRAVVSVDDSAFVLTTDILGGTAPVQRGTSGWVSLDLLASVMSGTKIDVEIRCDNANAIYPTFSIVTADLSPQGARYDLLAGSPRIERLWLDDHDFLWNRNDNEAMRQVVYNALGGVKGQATIAEGEEFGSRSKIV